MPSSLRNSISNLNSGNLAWRRLHSIWGGAAAHCCDNPQARRFVSGYRFSDAVTRSKSDAPLGAAVIRRLLNNEHGSSLLEFAVVLPLLVVFTVGIYDFSGAFNVKQKVEQAAQEGAIVAGAQPMSDIQSGTNPTSLQPVVTAVYNSLAASGVLPNAGASCAPPFPAPTQPSPAGLTWIYTTASCSSAGDQLVVTINRGWVAGGPPAAVGTIVQVSYPYHWQFNSVIQLLIPGATYASKTQLTETATVHNQM
jgi:Flp pilus assembly protein TadG